MKNKYRRFVIFATAIEFLLIGLYLYFRAQNNLPKEKIWGISTMCYGFVLIIIYLFFIVTSSSKPQQRAAGGLNIDDEEVEKSLGVLNSQWDTDRKKAKEADCPEDPFLVHIKCRLRNFLNAVKTAFKQYVACVKIVFQKTLRHFSEKSKKITERKTKEANRVITPEQTSFKSTEPDQTEVPTTPAMPVNQGMVKIFDSIFNEPNSASEPATTSEDVPASTEAVTAPPIIVVPEVLAIEDTPSSEKEDEPSVAEEKATPEKQSKTTEAKTTTEPEQVTTATDAAQATSPKLPSLEEQLQMAHRDRNVSKKFVQIPWKVFMTVAAAVLVIVIGGGLYWFKMQHALPTAPVSPVPSKQGITKQAEKPTRDLAHQSDSLLLIPPMDTAIASTVPQAAQNKPEISVVDSIAIYRQLAQKLPEIQKELSQTKTELDKQKAKLDTIASRMQTDKTKKALDTTKSEAGRRKNIPKGSGFHSPPGNGNFGFHSPPGDGNFGFHSPPEDETN